MIFGATLGDWGFGVIVALAVPSLNPMAADPVVKNASPSFLDGHLVGLWGFYFAEGFGFVGTTTRGDYEFPKRKPPARLPLP
ncbi:MAG: hypothetical protein CM15mP128_0900 [Methanobacteriota archaeon]|nr:MAG: hypothetical protein CM15mP128_0900 [Euryarchaeota archaeon]